MQALHALRNRISEPAKDIKLNLQAVLEQGSLSDRQRWGVAVAVAIASRNRALSEAVIDAARQATSEAVISDAVAAAALMAMNNVYYRFLHMVDSPAYSNKPARLRMNRLARPASSKLDFELMALAVSAVNGCESCVRAHEKVVIDGGLTEDQVHDAVRLAATLQATAVALEASVVLESPGDLQLAAE